MYVSLLRGGGRTRSVKHTIRILAIEDNPDDADLIRLMLRKVQDSAFSLEQARSLAEGLRLLRADRFDIVLLDLKLPDGAGPDLVRILREQEPNIPIIALTGLDNEDVAATLLHMDVQDYLVKDRIDSDLLARSLRYAIERQRYIVALQRSEARFRRLSESGIIGIAHFDIDGRITEANDALLSLIGYSRQELEKGAVRWDRLVPPEWIPYMLKLAAAFKATGRIPPYETEYLKRDGSRSWGVFGAAKLEGSGGIGFVADITERKKLEEEIRRLANHDPLTGLPNRRLFLELIHFELAEARRNQGKMGLLFLDLDRFKEVNDTLGHEAGDDLLKAVAGRLKSAIRASDAAARIGGDEFSVLLAGITRLEDITTTAQKILDVFREKFILGEREFLITMSVGISIYPDDSEDIETLFRYADMAMYRAKDRGGNSFAVYESIKSEKAHTGKAR